MGGGVHPLKVDVHPAKLHGVHTAPDVNAHNVGDRLVSDGHGGADGAAPARVDIRHDPDPGPGGEIVVAHSADLFDGLVLDHRRIAHRRIDLSFDLRHDAAPFVFLNRASVRDLNPQSRGARRS